MRKAQSSRKAPFQEWERAFRRSRLGKHALNELEAALSSFQVQPTFDRIERTILLECFNALNFERTTDQWEQARQRDKAINASFQKARAACVVILESASRHPKEFSVVAGEALLRAKNSGLTVKSPPSFSTSKSLSELLASLEQSLPTEKAPYSRPFLHQFRYGCLMFEKSRSGLKDNNRPTADFMLSFSLVFLFRCMSAMPPLAAWNNAGAAMPTTGKPHFPLVALFVNATFESASLTGISAAASLRAFLKRNPSVSYMGWS